MEYRSSLCDQILESIMLMSVPISYCIQHELVTRAQRPAGGPVPWPRGLTSFC